MRSIRRDKFAISRLEIIEDIQDVTLKLGRKPTISEFSDEVDYSAGVVYNRFDSWTEAVLAAGLEPSYVRVKREWIIEDIQELASELGRAPSHNELIEVEGYWSYGGFETWNDALEAAGFERRPPGENPR